MKKVTGLIKLQVPAGKANPSPPVGPALGQHGVNIMEFCKSFNARTQAQAALAKVYRQKKYALDEAFEILPQTKISEKYDETVDIAVRLGVDPKHADQMVRGAVNLPHGTGKTVRVAVFAKGDKAKEATEAGADAVGAEDLVDRIQKENWLEFDSAVSTPDLMGLVGKRGRVL